MAAIKRDDSHAAGRHYEIQHGEGLLKVPSVTTVLGIIGKPYLLNWAVSQGLDRALGHIRTHLQPGMTVAEANLEALLKESNQKGAKENQRILTAAGEFGTLAHECIEDFLHGEGRATPAQVQAKLERYVTDLRAQVETLYQKTTAAQQPLKPTIEIEDREAVIGKVLSVLDQFYAWWDAEGFQVVATELTVYSPTALAAGTLDCLATRRNVLHLLDWKTSNFYSVEYALQTVAYKMFVEELYGYQIDDIYVVRIGKRDAVMQVVQIPAASHAALWETFQHVRALWQWKQDYTHGSEFRKKKDAPPAAAPAPTDADAPPVKRRRSAAKAKEAFFGKELTPEQRDKLIANPAC